MPTSMSTSEITLALIAILISLAAIAVPLWRSMQRHGLCWAHLRPKSMLDIAEEVKSSLTIYYDDQPINNLTQYLFILHNTGFAPLDQGAIVQPLTWQAPGKILSARVIETGPDVKLSLNPRGQQLSISWSLFNQRCKALIEVLCEGNPNTGVGQIIGQITNVPIIKQKEVKWVGEEKKILDKIFQWIIEVYLVLAGLLILLSVVSYFIENSILIAVIVFVVTAFFVSLFLMRRNPYTKLLRNIKGRADSA